MVTIPICLQIKLGKGGDRMKIGILGAGAMGCLYGAYLSTTNEVLMVDVSVECVDTIKEFGIRIEADGIKNYPVRAMLSGTCQEVVDILIVFVKTTYSRDALLMNKAMIGPHTLLVSLQNGAGNDRLLAEFADSTQVLIGNSEHSSVVCGYGKIKHAGSGITRIGSLCGQETYANQVYALFMEAGIPTQVIENIQEIIWKKLMVNLTLNPITAIFDIPIGDVRENPHTWELLQLVLKEAVHVARLDGTMLEEHVVLKYLEEVILKAGKGYTSMYQDVKNKRLTEIDFINGALVRQAGVYGEQAPYNQMLTVMVKAMEAQYK